MKKSEGEVESKLGSNSNERRHRHQSSHASQSQSVNQHHEDEYSEYPDHQHIYQSRGNQDILSCFTCGRGYCSRGDYRVRDHYLSTEHSQDNRSLATPLDHDDIPHDQNDNDDLTTQEKVKPLIVLDVSAALLPPVTQFHESLAHEETDSSSSDDIVDIEDRNRYPKEAFDSRHTPNTLDNYSDDGHDSCFSCRRRNNNSKKSGISNSRRRRQYMQATYQRNQQPDYDLEDEESEATNLGKYHHPKEVMPTPTPVPDDPASSSLNQSLSF